MWLLPAAVYGLLIASLVLGGLGEATSGDWDDALQAFGFAAVLLAPAVWWRWRRRARERARDDALVTVPDMQTATKEDGRRWTWRGHGLLYWVAAAAVYLRIALGFAACIAAMAMYG